METEDNFKNSPIHDKRAIIEMMDKLEPKEMVKVIDFIQEQAKVFYQAAVIGSSSSCKIEIDFLGGDKKAKLINHLMHAADTFERGKQLAIHERYIVTGNPDLPKLCERIATAYEQAGGYAIFVGIRKVNGKRAVNPYAWFMSGVQSISMQQKNKPLGWALFRDILAQIGYNSKTDENMRVVAVY
jgi:hypothetical protein